MQSKNIKIISKTPFGPVGVLWSAGKKQPLIFHIFLSKPGSPAEKTAAKLFPHVRISSCAKIETVASSIQAYLEGEHVKFDLKLVHLSPLSEFQQAVLRAQHAIPRGSVSTYGLIAEHVGVPGGARAVGNVMAINPFPLIIPCHRTIRSDLSIGGFQSGLKMKRALLEKEGIVFDEAAKVIRGRLHYSPPGVSAAVLK